MCAPLTLADTLDLQHFTWDGKELAFNIPKGFRAYALVRFVGATVAKEVIISQTGGAGVPAKTHLKSCNDGGTGLFLPGEKDGGLSFFFDNKTDQGTTAHILPVWQNHVCPRDGSPKLAPTAPQALFSRNVGGDFRIALFHFLMGNDTTQITVVIHLDSFGG